MSLLKAGEQSLRGATAACHVCGKLVENSDVAVEHDGNVGIANKSVTIEGHGHIIMHTECAAVLGMRLIHDAMQNRERTEQTPQRAVELLKRKE